MSHAINTEILRKLIKLFSKSNSLKLRTRFKWLKEELKEKRRVLEPQDHSEVLAALVATDKEEVRNAQLRLPEF